MPAKKKLPQAPRTSHLKNEKTLGMLCHLLAFSGYLFPFGNIVVPLILWSLKREESAFIDDQGKESLNFQISMTILLLIAFVLCFVLIGIPLVFALIVYHTVYTIIAAIKASEGKKYRYPFNFRFLE